MVEIYRDGKGRLDPPIAGILRTGEQSLGRTSHGEEDFGRRWKSVSRDDKQKEALL